MAVIDLKIVVARLSDVMENFTHIKIYRSTTIDGTYTEISTPSTRPVLESGLTIYDFSDTNGLSTYYYKSSYFHPVSGLESSLSEAQQGEGDPALDIVSVDELKTNYLFGLDLTNDEGTEYPDSLYEWFIKSAVSWLEHKLDMPIRPLTVTEEKHDYFREDYDKFIWIKLKKFPVIDVSEVRLVLPGEQLVQTFEREWIQLNKDAGQLQLVPGTGTAGSILLGASGAWLPLIYGQNRFVPHAFRVDYTAGFESGEVPDIFKDAIAKIASYGPLNIAGDLLGGAGIASQAISIDGLSQSFNTTSSSTSAGYGARLIQYTKEIKDVLPTLRRYYKGIPMVVC